MIKNTRLFVIMGVAGSGKTSVGTALAAKLKATYLDGDDFHPPSNIGKMSQGIPLDDADREPWLRLVGQNLKNIQGTGIIGCSALKKKYRKIILEQVNEPVCFIYLDGDRDLIATRMSTRSGHFMPPALLDSQFDALEIPHKDELTISVDISNNLEQIVEDIISQIT